MYDARKSKVCTTGTDSCGQSYPRIRCRQAKSAAGILIAALLVFQFWATGCGSAEAEAGIPAGGGSSLAENNTDSGNTDTTADTGNESLAESTSSSSASSQSSENGEDNSGNSDESCARPGQILLSSFPRNGAENVHVRMSPLRVWLTEDLPVESIEIDIMNENGTPVFFTRIPKRGKTNYLQLEIVDLLVEDCHYTVSLEYAENEELCTNNAVGDTNSFSFRTGSIQ